MSQVISERKCRFLGNFHSNCVASRVIKTNYHKMVIIYIIIKLVLVEHGGHVCMPACILYIFIAYIIMFLFSVSLPLYKAAHVANKVVYIDI